MRERTRQNVEVDGHWSNYFEYSKTLRAWLVAYGVGGPVLLATNQAFSNKVILSGRATEIIQWFLLGVALQVFLAFVNKYCAYHQYLGAEEPEHKKTWGFGFWNWVNYYWQIDLVLDLASVIAFAKATIIVLSVYVSA